MVTRIVSQIYNRCRSLEALSILQWNLQFPSCSFLSCSSSNIFVDLLQRLQALVIQHAADAEHFQLFFRDHYCLDPKQFYNFSVLHF